MGCCDKDENEEKGPKKGCCGKSPSERRDIENDGCCDEDCCNRTCCCGRAACSLEAGFAATFALLSFGAMLYANNACNYVQLRGNVYYDENSTGGGAYSDYYITAGMQRGIFFGQPVNNVTCLSWISIERLAPEQARDLVYIDPWWYASMGCAAAALAFGFASLVQIIFISCFPRSSQRYAARCASAMAIIAAVLEGCTLLYVNSSAVKNVHWPYNPEVDFTTFTLDIAAWCAVASCGAWFITAFILCFLKNPPDPTDAATGAAALEESNRSSRGSEKRGSAHEQDEEAGEEEVLAEEDVEQENGPDSPAGAAVGAGAAAGAATALFVAAQSSDEAETDNEYEDAVMGGSDLHHSHETAFASESNSNYQAGSQEQYSGSPGWGYYRKSADDFVDG